MDVFIVFKQIFDKSLELLNYPIDLGNGIKLSLFGLFVSVAVFGLVVSIVRHLYD